MCFIVLIYSLLWQLPITTFALETDVYSPWEAQSPKQNARSLREQEMAKQLLRDYKENIRPRGLNQSNPKDGGPVLVYVTVSLRSITSINDANMEFTAQFYFLQEWYDTRLRFEHLTNNEIDYISLASDQKIWLPDTFFQNEKQGHYHDVDKANMYIRIRYDGRVIYSRRLSMTFSCAMYLGRYPHDTQFCVMEFGSYAYTTDDIEYRWNEIRLDTMSKSRPKFSIDNVSPNTCTSKTNTGEYSCLKVDLQLRRVFSFFMLQLYVPSIMLVSVSCVSYWIDWKASPARVPLSIVTLLTMITQSHSINSSLPPVSYTKAIDIWIGACIVFIFSSLIEYAIVNYTGVQEERKKDRLREQNVRRFYSGHEPLQSPFSAGLQESSSSHRQQQKNRVIQAHRPNLLQSFLAGFRRHEISSSVARRLAEAQAASTPTTGDCRYSLRSGGSGAATKHQFGFVSATATNDFDVEQLPLPNSRNRRELFSSLLPCCYLLQQKGRAERIDIVSRVFFPISFMCFNAVYWTVYWS